MRRFASMHLYVQSIGSAFVTESYAALSQHERLSLGRLVAERHPGAQVVDLIGYLETAREQGHLIHRPPARNWRWKWAMERDCSVGCE